jgi:hypothetical protein
MDEAERLELVERVLADPPLVHPEAPNGKVWWTQPSCYRFLARHTSDGARTLETGAGVSTVLFAGWGCNHLSVTPDAGDQIAVEAFCRDHGIDTSTLVFDLQPSEEALPTLSTGCELDLLLIDGAHSFPMPTIDWFYGARHLKQGGVVVFDDANLPAVRTLLDSFLGNDGRWQQIGGTAKWRAYRRLSEGPLAEHESAQPFYVAPNTPTSRVKRFVPLSVRRLVRRVLPER